MHNVTFTVSPAVSLPFTSVTLYMKRKKNFIWKPMLLGSHLTIFFQESPDKTHKPISVFAWPLTVTKGRKWDLDSKPSDRLKLREAYHLVEWKLPNACLLKKALLNLHAMLWPCHGPLVGQFPSSLYEARICLIYFNVQLIWSFYQFLNLKISVLK